MNNVLDFGAVGDGKTKDTAAVQKAIDAGGIVFFPPGVYLCGTLYLKSCGGLELAPGAVILGSPDKEDYNADDFCVQNSFSTVERSSGAHLIVVLEQHDVVIRGGGRIDGNRQAFYGDPAEKERKFTLSDWRPGQMVFVCESENVTITDVELNHAAYWTLFLYGCENVMVRGVRIWNDYRTHNGDGIDIDCCRFVTVSDCIIHSGDDCITFRGNTKRLKNKKPCEYVTVTNCVLGTSCNALRIGVGDGIIRNCTVSNLIVKDTRTGIQINSAYSTDSGVGIENILFSNICMEVKKPFALFSHFRGLCDQEIKPMRNIRFSNISTTAVANSAICANHVGDIEGITFSDVEFIVGSDENVQPMDEYFCRGYGVESAPAVFYVENAKNVKFRNVNAVYADGAAKWQYGVVSVNTEKMILDSCGFDRENIVYEKK